MMDQRQRDLAACLSRWAAVLIEETPISRAAFEGMAREVQRNMSRLAEVNVQWASERYEAQKCAELQEVSQEVSALKRQKVDAARQLSELEAQAGQHVLVASRPSRESIRAKRQELCGLAVSVSHYAENFAYIAVVGAGGAGKSSLINSARGLKRKAQGAAPVKSYLSRDSGADSRSLAVYPAQNIPLVFFEIPSFGDMDNLRWNFFEAQSLYAYDAVILVWESRLTDTDVSIIANCCSLGVPIKLVRTKADIDLKSQQDDAKATLEEIIRDYRASTRQYVNQQLASLPQSNHSSRFPIETFILSETCLRHIVTQSCQTGVEMDERKFVEALRVASQPRDFLASTS
eukprot:Gregarina_sp_Pseudo_9__1687@NODE_2140_length_1132_cov_18_781336_g1974_i0_p1_GENE_NODE_2140_length_1132_cov_18_781336_g1974_i0NODE_2140_length_1132_cov_18_781336_g1974_i0_p1_ORF_typecomplete_len356_score42_44IIGP/PF05049_13/1_2e32IIGP/PF05049_13/8_7e02RsgA_GTPase/PF03193_16/0_00079RsgA_GTPase/PF03193_16/1e02MMR_HSR1/PF01926_23/0_00062ABC_tran/PF00005_27/9e02ABC_tran/PF00005_27/0_0032FeoB_N/PF02421_18/0_0049Dynamin_N/PF00350_23/1_4e03Dynamin_N/PF00350_23/0_014AIG1/PF04548_16/0_015Ad_Cy_reg/PF16701